MIRVVRLEHGRVLEAVVVLKVARMSQAVENEDNRMFTEYLGPGSSNNVLLKFQVKSSLRL